MESHPLQSLLKLAEQKFGELNVSEKTLFRLAQKKFQELRDSEYKLFRAIANGQPIDYRTGTEEAGKPEQALAWGEERTLRGDCLRWLCVDPEVWKLCLPCGVNVSGAKVEGSLNLSFSEVEIPLCFFCCYFAEALRLHQAKLKQLDLSGTYITSSELSHYAGAPQIPTAVDARKMSITDSVLLGNGFQAQGLVTLSGASIGGDLNCIGGTFTNAGGFALAAQSVNVTGSVLLGDGFQAQGLVSFLGATIGGILYCIRGTFTNARGAALIAQSIKVTGSVLLSSFQAWGLVDFFGATIGGNLECAGGTFTNVGGNALIAESVNVTGSVVLTKGFQAQGLVSFFSATIGGNFECVGGTFINAGEDALIAQSVNITGSVLLRSGFQSQGMVSFLVATIRGNFECVGGTFTNAGGTALLAEGVNVTGSVLLSNGFQAQGRVILSGATIGGTLLIERLKAPQGTALDLQFAKVQTLEHVDDSFPVPGNLELNGLVFMALGKGAPQKWDDQLKWLRLQPRTSFSSQPYEHLAKVLQSSGYRDEAIRVLIGKEDDQLRYGNLSWFSKGWKRVLGAIIAYGYRPQKAIFIAIGAVIAAGFLFSAGYQHGLITPMEKGCKPRDPQAIINDCSNYPNYPKFNPYVYSLDVFLPIIDLRLKSSWQPNANNGKVEDKLFHIKSGGWLRWYFWFHIILGWALTTLWVAGFSGLVRNTNK